MFTIEIVRNLLILFLFSSQIRWYLISTFRLLTLKGIHHPFGRVSQVGSQVAKLTEVLVMAKDTKVTKPVSGVTQSRTFLGCELETEIDWRNLVPLRGINNTLFFHFFPELWVIKGLLLYHFIVKCRVTVNLIHKKNEEIFFTLFRVLLYCYEVVRRQSVRHLRVVHSLILIFVIHKYPN